MARNFLPGLDAHFDLRHFQGHLSLEEAWPVNGQHYAKTCEIGQELGSKQETDAGRACQERAPRYSSTPMAAANVCHGVPGVFAYRGASIGLSGTSEWRCLSIMATSVLVWA